MDNSGEEEPPYYDTQSDHSQQHRMFVERNSQEEQQIVIPYWDESSSSQYHLAEQVKLLKKKNQHFQAHMERMKAEYEQLRASLEEMDENEREHIRKYGELMQRYNGVVLRMQELKAELEGLRRDRNEMEADLKAREGQEDENRRKIAKLKDTEVKNTNKIYELQEEIKLLVIKSEEERKIIERAKQKQIELLRKQLNQKESPYDSQLIDELQSTINNLRASLTEKDKRILFLQNQNSSKADQIVGLKQQVDRVRRQIEHNQKNQTNLYESQNEKLMLQKQNNELKNLVKSLKNEITRLNSQARKLEAAALESNRRVEQGQSSRRSQSILSAEKTIDMIYTGVRGTSSEQSLKIDLKTKEAMISKLKDRINNDEELNRRRQARIRELQEKLREKERGQNSRSNKQEELLQRLQEMRQQSEEKLFQKETEINKLKLRLDDLEAIHAKHRLGTEYQEKSLTQLEAEYNGELQALRRLVLYKRYPQGSSSEVETRLRAEYQHKFDILVSDYQELQKQLLLLQQDIVLEERPSDKEVITFRTSEEERMLYLQAIRKWQIAYEELHAIYEAKLVSKDEEIKLLNLRLGKYT